MLKKNSSDSVSFKQPLLPFFFQWFPLFNGVLPAERIIALRMGIGITFLLEIIFCIYPYRGTWQHFIQQSIFAESFAWPHLRWSISTVVSFEMTLLIGVIGCFGLVVGKFARLAAVLCFVASVSIFNDLPFATNGGDMLRTPTLLFLCFSPTFKKTRNADGDKLKVPAWPIGMCLFLLSMMYFLNGFHKLHSPDWRDGSVMKDVFGDWNWSLVAGINHLIPLWFGRISAYATLAWELSFPIVAFFPRVRSIWLIIGCIFHIGTFFTLVVGLFPIYSLCLYLPFIPWEKWTK